MDIPEKSDADRHPRRPGYPQGRLRLVWWSLFAAGLAISALMVLRSQLWGDQLNQLARGWLFAVEGEWLQYGLPTSAGGKAPGGLISLLAGGPLLVWLDHRAPAVLIWLLHLMGFLLLDRVIARTFGPVQRVLFLVFYWLTPWRLYFSGHLWNVNYLFIFGAIHAWTAFGMRIERRFWMTMVHIVALGLAVQTHLSAAVLVIASGLLWSRGFIRIRPSGAVCGALTVIATLVPWFVVVMNDPDLLPGGGGGLPGRSLVLVYPMVRGLLYLMRYASLAVPSRLLDLEFAPGSEWGSVVAALVIVALAAVAFASLVLPCAAYRRLLRHPRRWSARPSACTPAPVWLRGYAVWCLAAALIAFAVSPTTPMFWQALGVYHAVAMVTVFFVSTMLRSRRRFRVRRWVAGYALVMVAFNLALCFGGPMYRSRGPVPAEPFVADETKWFRLRGDHPMLHDLRIVERCRVVVVEEDGWWPDVLPEPEQSADPDIVDGQR